MTDKQWQHLFLASPYQSSVLVLALDQDAVVGTANLIPQRLNLNNTQYDYYLFTTSAVHENFRQEGVYFETIKIIKDLLGQDQKKFILAFPNHNAYRLLTGLSGFHALGPRDIMHVTDLDPGEITTLKVEDSIHIDEAFLKWRFEHADYFYLRHNRRLLICKNYDKSLDIVEVIDKDHEGLLSQYIPRRSSDCKQAYIQRNRLGPGCKINGELSTTIFPTYLPADPSLELNCLDVSLLMSDVF